MTSPKPAFPSSKSASPGTSTASVSSRSRMSASQSCVAPTSTSSVGPFAERRRAVSSASVNARPDPLPTISAARRPCGVRDRISRSANASDCEGSIAASSAGLRGWDAAAGASGSGGFGSGPVFRGKEAAPAASSRAGEMAAAVPAASVSPAASVAAAATPIETTKAASVASKMVCQTLGKVGVRGGSAVAITRAFAGAPLSASRAAASRYF